jgi:hypothetical protein
MRQLDSCGHVDVCYSVLQEDSGVTEIISRAAAIHRAVEYNASFLSNLSVERDFCDFDGFKGIILCLIAAYSGGAQGYPYASGQRHGVKKSAHNHWGKKS